MEATRDEVYKRFGPQLLEVVACLMLDEVNTLRKSLNLPLRTKKQLLSAIAAKWEETPRYEWMIHPEEPE